MASFLTSLYNHPWLHPFLALSYPTSAPTNPDSFPNSNYYNSGLLDTCFVISWMAVLAVLREILRLGVFEPFASWYLQTGKWKRDKRPVKSLTNGGNASTANGHANGNGASVSIPTRRRLSKKDRLRERNVIRFAEQGWEFAYYSVYWTYGMYIHFSSPTAPFELDKLWIGYPHIPLAAAVKFYYLTQAACWLHQVLILNAEAHRKDHYQMMAHHFITIGLMFASYHEHFTRVGCLILVLMDWCDIILAFGKMLRYLELRKACDMAFVVFLVSWFLTRHVLFIRIIVSTYSDSRNLINDAFGDPTFTFINWTIFLTLLIALQVILCIWFLAICKVTYKVIMGGNVEDIRSDDEDMDGAEDDNRIDSPVEVKKDR